MKSLGLRSTFYPLSPSSQSPNGNCQQDYKIYPQEKLDASKWAWVDKLPQVLWAIQTTSITAIGETLFSTAYGAEAISLVEVRLPFILPLQFNKISNDELRRYKLGFLNGKR